jgi:multidrug efflux pump subunit AcrA (membrane-fusion protein)
VVVLCLIAISLAAATQSRWRPAAQSWVQSVVAGRRVKSFLDEHDHSAVGKPADEHHEHAAHDHSDHEAANSLKLSAQAQGNLGLTAESLRPIELETFHRTLTVPGIVVDRPGRTRIEVSTPMAGVVTKVHAVKGEAVEPGTLLFEIRITAEELVESQTELLKTLGELDVEEKEIARLTKFTESEAIPKKTLLERQYAKEKLENMLVAQREALRLHGLSDAQIVEITSQRRLFRDLKIVAPLPGGTSGEFQLTRTGIIPASYQESAQQPPASSVPTQFIITEMPVHVGQTIAAGTTLAELADYSELYIEGRTFERDVKALSRVTASGWKISALFEGLDGDRETVPDLELVYAATEIHIESRTLPFYVRLPNEMIRSTPSPNGHAFVEWRHRPGRRVQLLVPIEELKDQIVLPVEAIAREGAESYVFQQNGGHFDRIPVRIKYRNSTQAVIANDGSVFPGDVVARTGAHQMLMALKNKSGGGVDPHAGHNH